MQIKNNNIQIVSPTGKVFFGTFFHVRELINSPKVKYVDQEVDFRNTVCYTMLGWTDDIISIPKEPLVVKVAELNGETSSFYNHFRDALETSTELVYEGWKFKVI